MRSGSLRSVSMCAARTPGMLLAGGLNFPMGKRRWSKSGMAELYQLFMPRIHAYRNDKVRPARGVAAPGRVGFRRARGDDGGGDDGDGRWRMPVRQTPSEAGQQRGSFSCHECSTSVAAAKADSRPRIKRITGAGNALRKPARPTACASWPMNIERRRLE